MRSLRPIVVMSKPQYAQADWGTMLVCCNTMSPMLLASPPPQTSPDPLSAYQIRSVEK